MKGTIRSVAYDQHEILYNIMQMHNGGEPFDCDLTYSKGAFYGDFTVTNVNGDKTEISLPRPKHTFDVCPQDDETVKIEPLGSLPLEDGSIGSIVFDPPFCVSIGKSMSQDPRHTEDDDKKKRCIITNRFHAYYPRQEMYKSYSHWLQEIARVLKPGGICVFKCQSTITGGIYAATDSFTWFEATRNGLYTLDKFYLVAKSRLIGNVKQQQHARNFVSIFWVFQKPGKGTKAIEDYYGWMDDSAEDKETLRRIMNSNKK